MSSHFRPSELAIRTFMGHYVNLLAPKLEDIDLRDIAHHLSLECRWGGATKRHYSVNEHQLWVARFVAQLVPARFVNVAKLYSCVHDAHEYVFKDIPAPLKKLLGEPYLGWCHNVDLLVWQKVHLPPPHKEMQDAIKAADSYAAWCEAQVLLTPCARAKFINATEPPAEMRKLVGMEAAISREPQHIEQDWLSAVTYLMGQV